MNPRVTGATSGAISGAKTGGWVGAIIGGIAGAAGANGAGEKINNHLFGNGRLNTMSQQMQQNSPLDFNQNDMGIADNMKLDTLME